MTNGARLLVVALVVTTLAGAGRAALRVSHGLSAEYFTNTGRSGSPAFTAVDAEPSTTALSARWAGAPPEAYSARWRGYLAVPRSGLYRFATTSDDGSWLYVDGRLIVDNGGTHGTLTKAGQTFLERGPHFILIEYFQAGGPYAMQWLWSADAGALTPVPSWLLSTRRMGYATAFAVRLLDWILWLSLTAALAAACAIALPLARVPRMGGAKYPRLALLALFVALAVVETWPLAANPARLSRNDNGDTMLNEWIVAWVVHQGTRDPSHLFDANIFYPERNTLAYSEAMLPQAAMAAPLLWLGASPVLAYNLVLIAGFALTGFAMCLVLSRWTGDSIAGIAGGILMGFNAHTLTRMPHLQAQHVEFLPFALFAFDRLLVAPGPRAALTFAGWFALQALASFYLMVISVVALIVSAIVRPETWARKRGVKIFACLAFSAAAAGVVLLPYLLPYWRLNHQQGFTRPLAQVADFAATWHDYLTTPGRIPRIFLANVMAGSGLYPGAVGVALSVVALTAGIAWRDPRARMCLAFGVFGVLLSFGPHLPGYAFLYRAFTPLQAVRAVSRFGYLGIVSVAALGAYGFAHLRRRWRGRPWIHAASAAIIVAIAMEPLAAPIGYVRYDGVPRIYDTIAREPGVVTIELPLPMPRGAFFNAAYMINSTRHWKPMVNGYSGFVPDSYVEHYNQLHTFPAPETIAVLQRLGVTHAFVHRDALGPAKSADLDRRAGLIKLAAEGDIVLYQVAPASAHK